MKRLTSQRMWTLIRDLDLHSAYDLSGDPTPCKRMISDEFASWDASGGCGTF
jgi:hypothetical protein